MVKEIPCKKVCYPVKPTDYWFKADYNMNIYKGCNHGCIYCDSRSLCYQIENFDEVKIKEGVVEKLSLELTAKRRKGIISLGAMSDCYNLCERELEATRRVLKVIRDTRFGVVLYTKSDLVVRDIDILKAIPNALVVFTVTCGDDELSRIIEPGAPVSSRRFQAMKKLADAGIKTGVAMVPLLPHINDTIANVDSIIDKTGSSGGLFIYPSFGLTCRDGQREYFYWHLDRHFPGLRQTYQNEFNTKYNCSSKNAAQLGKYFTRKCGEAGIVSSMAQINRMYYPQDNEQLSLF